MKAKAQLRLEDSGADPTSVPLRTGGASTTLSRSDMERLNTQGRCCLVIRGKVHDVTDWLHLHPGAPTDWFWTHYGMRMLSLNDDRLYRRQIPNIVWATFRSRKASLLRRACHLPLLLLTITQGVQPLCAGMLHHMTPRPRSVRSCIRVWRWPNSNACASGVCERRETFFDLQCGVANEGAPVRLLLQNVM